MDTPTQSSTATVQARNSKSSCMISGLITDLLSSSLVNENHPAQWSPLIHPLSEGLTLLIQNLHQQKETFGIHHSRRMLLRPLVPIYLSAGQGKLGTGLSDTLSLFRSTLVVAELNGLMDSSDLTEWFMTIASHEDPLPYIETTFHISVSRLAKRFWHSAFVSKNRGATMSKRAVETLALDASKDKRAAGWWSLACQISDQNQKIRVPAEVAVGLVDWNRLLDHWHRLELALDGEIELIDGPSLKQDHPNASDDKAASLPARKVPKLNDRRFVEIRSINDPELSSNLEKMLVQARSNQSELTLLVIKCLEANVASSSSVLQNWQSKFIHHIDQFGATANARGFISDEGDLSLVYEDAERSEVAQWIRESFVKLNETAQDAKLAVASAIPLAAGVASVIAPSRSFKIEQLIQAALRCLDGAAKQGSGAVKTIEVY